MAVDKNGGNNGLTERSLNMEYRYDNLTMDNKYKAIKEKLFIDCSNCSGLCCVDLYFAKSEGFPYDKPAGEPCKNLMEDFRCKIHDTLLEKKMKGCLAYDCFGAGQKVTSVIYNGASWRASQQVTEQMSAVFLIITRLHQMLWYLIEASSICATKDLWEDIARLIEENNHMTDITPDKILELDLEQYKKRVDRILKKSSDLVALSFKKPEGQEKQENTDKEKMSDYIGKNLQKKDLAGKDFSLCLMIAANIKGCKLKGANFLGTDMRDTNIEDADLSESFFLTQGQINAARGNAGTKLPAGLIRPLTWKS